MERCVFYKTVSCVQEETLNERKYFSPGFVAVGWGFGVGGRTGWNRLSIVSRSAPAAGERLHVVACSRVMCCNRRPLVPRWSTARCFRPQRKLTILDQTDVLVVGGGPAGRVRCHRRGPGGRQGNARRTLQPFRRPVDGRAGARRAGAPEQGAEAGVHGRRRRDDATSGEGRGRHCQPSARRLPPRSMPRR